MSASEDPKWKSPTRRTTSPTRSRVAALRKKFETQVKVPYEDDGRGNDASISNANEGFGSYDIIELEDAENEQEQNIPQRVPDATEQVESEVQESIPYKPVTPEEYSEKDRGRQSPVICEDAERYVQDLYKKIWGDEWKEARERAKMDAKENRYGPHGKDLREILSSDESEPADEPEEYSEKDRGRKSPVICEDAERYVQDLYKKMYGDEWKDARERAKKDAKIIRYGPHEQDLREILSSDDYEHVDEEVLRERERERFEAEYGDLLEKIEMDQQRGREAREAEEAKQQAARSDKQKKKMGKESKRQELTKMQAGLFAMIPTVKISLRIAVSINEKEESSALF